MAGYWFEMSGENTETVRRSFDAWNRNDWEELERCYHPNAVAKTPEGWPEGGVLEGWEAIRNQMARNKDSWEEEQVEVVELRELDLDRVMARIRWTTTGSESHLAFESGLTALFTLREGRIARLDYYFDHAKALEAAGIGEAAD
jgi:ketosteroid isomerase-like protein